MCLVSFVSVAAAKIPAIQWSLPTLTEFQQILNRLDALDKKLGQPDCQDPLKLKWMESVEQRLRQLEVNSTSD